jgi:hypothetical protein
MGKFGQQASSVVQVAATAEDARLGTETQALRKQALPPQQQMQSQTGRTFQRGRQRDADDVDAGCCCLALATLCCCFVAAPTER